MITKCGWTTSRKDMDSFTTNPETGETEHVVYVYRGDKCQRIAVFENNARSDADGIAAAMNSVEEIGEMADTMDNLSAASKLPIPSDVHIKQLRVHIEEASAKLKKIYSAITGENPWKV